ncbi:MAG TPA: hypothetical protein VF402_08035, partial [Asticcacaulis sp.]
MTSALPFTASERHGAVSLGVLALAACLALSGTAADARTRARAPSLRAQILAETQHMLDAQKAQF